jgi:hypothetical protein
MCMWEKRNTMGDTMETVDTTINCSLAPLV